MNAGQTIGKTLALCDTVEAVKARGFCVAAQVSDAGSEEPSVVSRGAGQSAKQLPHWQETDVAQCLIQTIELRLNALRSAKHMRERIDDVNALGSGQGCVRTVSADA